MDTSEQYIKMCDTSEIQSGVEPPNQCGGFYWCKTHKVLMDHCDGGYLWCVYTDCKGDNYLWLPSQDQLQEMVFNDVAGTYNLLPTKLFAFSDYWEENGIPIEFTSMEQLWLAFGMKEKFDKIWDGKWIKSISKE